MDFITHSFPVTKTDFPIEFKITTLSFTNQQQNSRPELLNLYFFVIFVMFADTLLMSRWQTKEITPLHSSAQLLYNSLDVQQKYQKLYK